MERAISLAGLYLFVAFVIFCLICLIKTVFGVDWIASFGIFGASFVALFIWALRGALEEGETAGEEG